MTALLEVEGLAKSFGDFTAVAGVDLVLPGGGITAVIGPNGAGKTTLINLLTGRLEVDRGEIRFGGADVTRWPASARIRAGMGRAFQVTSVFPRLPVEANVAIPVVSAAGLAFRPWRRLDRLPDVRREVARLLDEVGLGDRAGAPAGELSHGDQRLLELALALATGPRLIFLDEPTAGMAPGERERVLARIRHLADAGGLTFLLVEHDMDVVFGMASRIVVMHQGRVIADGSPEAIRADARVREVYLGEADHAPLREAPAAAAAGEVLLEVERLGAGYGLSQVLSDVSFTVRRGEVTALLGRNGVGKTTTMRSLVGLNVPYAGSRIRLAGRDIAGLAPESIAALGVGYVPDDRRIFPDLSVRENLRLPRLALRQTEGRWSEEKIGDLFPPLRALWDRQGRHLSGGEQKMLAIGRALMAEPSLLLLDEPSEGLSPLIVGLLAEALDRIRAEGVTILLADQNLPFARRVADQALVMERGRIVHAAPMPELAADEATLRRLLAV
ncbi:MAG TPA: ATP-binding cassette domain-containing protein [Thermodesulfobacteriota bacterium]